MKWVKTAIGAVIILSIIPLIINTINNLSDDGYQGDYSIMITQENINETALELFELIEVNEDGIVSNYLEVIADDNVLIVSDFFINSRGELILIIEPDGRYILTLDIENNMFHISSTVDYILITLNVNIESEPLVSPTILSLITLIPLIISASLLTYLYKGIRNREL